ncbi:MAG: hypothetical protein ACYDAE_13045 [Steroidobacteraceae bacterium]
MAMSQHAYMRTRNQEKVRSQATRSRATVAISRQNDLRDFYDEVARLSETDLDKSNRKMASLADKLRNNEPLSKDGEVKKAVAEVLEQVRGVVEEAHDYKQLVGRLQLPVYAVIREPPGLGPEGATLALVIALLQCTECFLKLRRRTHSRRA